MLSRRIAPLLLLATSCATPGRPAETACPDARPLCLSGLECTVDPSGGCEVCVCRSADESTARPAGPARARPEDERQVLPPLR